MLKSIFLVCIAILSLLVFADTTYAVEILYEHITTYQPSRGITYKRNRMMTSNGMLDVHVLKIDLYEPHIYIRPVASETSLGLREATTNLLSNAGAVAGINADFFVMAGSYSIHFGPMAADGQLLAARASTNAYYSGFATLFLDVNNNAFFRYMRSDIRFYNNGMRNVTVGAYNNIGNTFDVPTIVDRLAMEDTSNLDTRFKNLTKIVVQGDRIVQISLPGQTVSIPVDGYVLILPGHMVYRRRYFNVGDTANLVITNNAFVNFENIQSAIGGGGLILSNGQVVNDQGVVPAGRHPRSAIGVSSDGRYMILMTVDGRSHSIGANHVEMAYLLLRFGANNAMHFDGGGSATLVTSNRGENHRAVNTLSEGSERRVVNALGVFDRAPVGNLAHIVLEMGVSRAIVGVPVYAYVHGEDEFWNRLTINAPDVTFFVEDESGGFWADGLFTPVRPGRHVLEASFGEFRATQTIYAYYLAELQPLTSSISLFEGNYAALRFAGVAVCGTALPVSAVTWLTVTPSSLGHFENGAFVATGGGAGFISAGIDDIVAHIPVSVGGFPVAINMHQSQISRLAVPEDNIVYVSTETVQGSRIIRMDYVFEPRAVTQAAYVIFYPSLQIPNGAIGLRLQVHGDGSGHWLRGRVRDANGRTHFIDFTHSADFIGWESVIARLPNVPGPLTIDQIYMVTLNSYAYTHHQVFFYSIEAMFAPTNLVTIPQSTQFHDPLRGSFASVPGISPLDFGIPQDAVYMSFNWHNFSVTTIAANQGGISATDRIQWSRFMQDIRARDPEYVVILMDANPLNFRQRMEFELFHLAMQELRDEGRLIFVVSATGEETVLTMRDGVRYIDKAQPEAGLAAIRFWVNDGDIRWE